MADKEAPRFRLTGGGDEWTVKEFGWLTSTEQGWRVLATNLTLERATLLVKRQEAKQR